MHSNRDSMQQDSETQQEDPQQDSETEEEDSETEEEDSETEQQDSEAEQQDPQQNSETEEEDPQQDSETQQEDPQQDSEAEQQDPQQNSGTEQQDPQKDSETEQQDPQLDSEAQQEDPQQDSETQQEDLQQDSETEQQDSEAQQEPQQLSQATPTPRKPKEMLPEECDVCLHMYDEQERRPRTLPCGHTFCSLCLATLVTEGRLCCPSCCSTHPAPGVAHFPVNYALESMIRKLGIQQARAAPEATEESTKASAVKSKRRAAVGLSKKLRCMIQEQKGSMEGVVKEVQQELQQLGQYRSQLALSLAKHGSLLQELEKRVKKHQEAMKLLQVEDLKVETFMEEGQEGQRELQATQQQLEDIGTAQQAFRIIDSADHSTVVAEEWLQLSVEEFPDSAAFSTACRVVENTEAGLQVMADGEEAPYTTVSGHPDSSIMEVVKRIRDRSVELVDLRTNARFKKMVESGQVFGVEKKEDGSRLFSRVTCTEDKLFLHSMTQQEPPTGAFTFRVHEAVKNFPVTKVFLDLALPGAAVSQRLHIQLGQDTPLTRQFVSLCLGFLGPVYRDTKFTSVEGINSCNVVWGGDVSGQTSAENVNLPPIDSNLCGDTLFCDARRVVVSPELSDPLKSAQFGITVLSPSALFSFKRYYHVGRVEAGLSVVEEAINSNRITDLSVVDCGIVLSME